MTTWSIGLTILLSTCMYTFLGPKDKKMPHSKIRSTRHRRMNRRYLGTSIGASVGEYGTLEWRLKPIGTVGWTDDLFFRCAGWIPEVKQRSKQASDEPTVHYWWAPYRRSIRWIEESRQKVIKGAWREAFMVSLCGKSSGVVGRDLVTGKQYSCVEWFNNVD
jgi:hypothetical protein